MKNRILSKRQEELLLYFASSNVSKQIYWGGGTALSACYFKHRLSEDIDLFTKDLIDDISLQIFIKNLKTALKIKNLQSRIALNRRYIDLDGLKLEIAYFPFKSLAKKATWHNLSVDSLEDICTNKILALYQRNDPKDVFDLYFILQKTDFDLDRLIRNIHKKFGELIDKSLLIAKIHKNIENLDLLSPLIFNKTILQKIKKYFSTENRKYLFSILL